jgi:hypothetical protein
MTTVLHNPSECDDILCPPLLLRKKLRGLRSTSVRLGESSTESEKIGLTMLCSNIIVLAFMEMMTNIGAEYGQKQNCC